MFLSAKYLMAVKTEVKPGTSIEDMRRNLQRASSNKVFKLRKCFIKSFKRLLCSDVSFFRQVSLIVIKWKMFQIFQAVVYEL